MVTGLGLGVGKYIVGGGMAIVGVVGMLGSIRGSIAATRARLNNSAATSPAAQAMRAASAGIDPSQVVPTGETLAELSARANKAGLAVWCNSKAVTGKRRDAVRAAARAKARNTMLEGGATPEQARILAAGLDMPKQRKKTCK